jgi:hypothetical protein
MANILNLVMSNFIQDTNKMSPSTKRFLQALRRGGKKVGQLFKKSWATICKELGSFLRRAGQVFNKNSTLAKKINFKNLKLCQ